MKKQELYKDIIKYIEARLNLMDTMAAAKEIKDHYKQQLYFHMIEQRQQEIDKWLKEEINV